MDISQIGALTSRSRPDDGVDRSALLLCDQFPDLRDQIVRNVHDRFRWLNPGFVL
jgi:hypothetical protein